MLTSLSRVEPADRTAEQLQLTVRRAELAGHIERHTRTDGMHPTAVPRLTLSRLSQPQHPVHVVHEPAFCMLAQGSKRVLLNDEVYVYDSSHYFVVSQNLPVCGQVIDATPDAPCLGLRIDFNAKDIAALSLEMRGDDVPAERKCHRGLFTREVSLALLDPVLRLVSLLDTPEDIPTLAPLHMRELLYRLLRSPGGERLAQMGIVDSHSQRINQAIRLLQSRYTEPLHVEALAREVHMSTSSLHSHFKAVTAMSPLQFQKQLRLQEARRILMSEGVDAATAGHRVGYESQSQFNREYSRFFGAPPARDMKRLRERNLEKA